MKALIVIDMQNDFCKPNGSLYNSAAETIIPNIHMLIDKAFENDDIIIFTQDTHDYDYFQTQEGKNFPIEHCLSGTEGWRIVDELDIKNVPGNMVYHYYKDAFGYNDWENSDIPKDVEEIIICGTITSICVLTNVCLLKTYFPEVPIKVYANCCADITPEAHQAALTCMKAIQVEVIE